MTPLPARLVNPTRADAVRFLQRATFGGTPAEVARLQQIGVDAWLTEQFAAPRSTAMLERFNGPGNNTLWNAYWAGPLGDADQLRKRITYAMSQIFVSSRASGTFRVAHYNDVLEDHCFGTFRALLEAITLSPSMSRYLTYHSNKKAGSRPGSVPDENYAREVMQLFTIGLWRLDRAGRRWERDDGKGGVENVPAYGDEDITGLARVFTGIRDVEFGSNDRTASLLPVTGDFANKFHETGVKTFLGTPIPEGTNLEDSLNVALNTLADHPNVAPFICRQLIQRMVTSNPVPGYVRRVARVFDDDGSGNRGNLPAVIRAILLDEAAWRRDDIETFGKIREPALRFTVAARALNVTSSETRWRVADLGDDRTGLAQQPWNATSVFNFYRPGYVPPRTPLSEEGLVAPEMQIVNETSTIGWINFVSDFLRRQPNVDLAIEDLVELIKDARVVSDQQANALIDELEARLCPAGVSDATRAVIVEALKGAADDDYVEPNEPNGQNTFPTNVRARTHEERVVGAAVLVLASTDFIWEH